MTDGRCVHTAYDQRCAVIGWLYILVVWGEIGSDNMMCAPGYPVRRILKMNLHVLVFRQTRACNVHLMSMV